MKPQKTHKARENGGRDWSDISISRGMPRVGTGQTFSFYIFIISVH